MIAKSYKLIFNIDLNQSDACSNELYKNNKSNMHTWEEKPKADKCQVHILLN